MSFSFSSLRLSVFDFVVDGLEEGRELLCKNEYHKHNEYYNKHCNYRDEPDTNKLSEAELVNGHDADAEHDCGESKAYVIDYGKDECFIRNNEIGKKSVYK